MPQDLELIRNILSFIQQRGFDPGERLPSEREFAERYKVSRGAVREAIQTLVSVRILDVRPTTGNYLRDVSVESSFEALVLRSLAGLSISEKEITDSIETRLVLEREAIQLACRRATEVDYEALQAVIAATELRIDQGLSIEVEDTAFHHAITTASRNTVLARLLNAFYEMSESRRREYFTNLDHARETLNEHKAILAALKARDNNAVVELIEAHVMRARQYFGIKKVHEET